MIRVTVELIPFGIGRPEHLGTVEIANTGKGSATQGNYRFKMFGRGEQKRLYKEGAIEGFPRKRLLAWDLLYRVLRDAVGERNG